MNATATTARPQAPSFGPVHAMTTVSGPARAEAALGELPCLWVLPHRPESAGTARHLARTALQAWGVEPDATDRALLVVSELVTNAVEHAQPPIALHMQRPTSNGTLHVEVNDGGPALLDGPWTASCAPDEHGRGNSIIDFLTTAHGARPQPDGTTHWADLPTATS